MRDRLQERIELVHVLAVQPCLEFLEFLGDFVKHFLYQRDSEVNYVFIINSFKVGFAD